MGIPHTERGLAIWIPAAGAWKRGEATGQGMMPQEARDCLQGRRKSLGEGVEWSPGTQWGKGSYCFLFRYLLNFVLSAC